VVDAALSAVGASPLAERRVGELSDGERQRVLLARALAQQPEVLLLDEPTAFLDVAARVTVFGLLRELARDRDMSVVVSTHDLELVLRLADHVWLLDRGGALRTGPPEALVDAVAEVFDTDRLALDPGTGTFALRPADGPPVTIDGGPVTAALAARLLTRAGWRPVPDADTRVEAVAHDRFRVHRADRVEEVTGWAELAEWARRAPSGS
jgi:iron complex transport system ATP-binding protein